ncbi:hypothetical protein GXM_09903 [Nostoc sphaeroides CCNUC1]|uniref:Uncharacterized protein n=1 Tax=Nostoc sphaeroides CCNUC1 TaxID=2653204 RepID=A0A5P8WKL5_9NOSO|nr:hypothetical protein GXM_09903 [Nostoc sphaeroides CCNUC1]
MPDSSLKTSSDRLTRPFKILGRHKTLPLHPKSAHHLG